MLTKLDSIQGLRGIAALAVVYHHAASRVGWDGWLGAAGVDIFFVISGFVMWVVTSRRPTSPAVFLTNRIIRIVPVYWFYTAAFLLLALALPGSFPRFQLDWLHALASFFFVPSYSPSAPNEIWPVLAQGWTLNFEMFFYFVFALALFGHGKLRLLFVCVVLIGLAAARGAAPGSKNAIFLTYTDPILLEFVFGLLIAWTVERNFLARWWIGPLLLSAGLAAFATVLYVHAVTPRVLVWGVPSAALVWGAVACERVGYWPKAALVRIVGDASYSIYLLHTFIVSLLAKSATLAAAPYLFVASSLVASAIVGWGSFHFLERPLMALSSRLRTQKKPAPASASSTI
jgi:exopolysaccharide production protein ExoZ